MSDAYPSIDHVRSVKGGVDVIFGKGGAMEVFQEAKKDGRVRYLGFSAHTVEAAPHVRQSDVVSMWGMED